MRAAQSLKPIRAYTLVILALILLCHITASAVSPKIANIAGTVVDQAGATVGDAHVVLLGAAGIESQRAITDQRGRFNFDGVLATDYVVRVEKNGFREVRRVVHLEPGQTLSLQFRLSVAPILETVSVTPARGLPQEVFEVPQAQAIQTAEEIARRPANVLPQALRELPGVHVQQTTSGQGSPFIRGLTGQQVLALVNGIRFNNSTFRPGANQYTALVDPDLVDRVEIVRGPGSTQYGSDSLGGTINFFTGPVRNNNDSSTHGNFNIAFASADLSAAGSANVSGGSKKWGYNIAAAGRRTQDLRPGKGIDSHSVATRLLGISSKVLGERHQDTAYGQYNADARFQYELTDSDLLSFEYLTGTQLGLRRYDQLNGGVGNLLNSFDPQVLNFFTARYDRVLSAPFESFTAIASFNGQRDDRRSQSINNATGLRSRITDEFNLTQALGLQAQATLRPAHRHLVTFGGELFNEKITSRRQDFSFNGATGGFTNVADVRARFPNGSRYRTVGIFAQDIATLVPQKLIVNAGIRYSNFHFSQSSRENPLDAAGRPTVPDFKTTFDDLTFNAGLVYQVNNHIALSGNVSRGFRAPNVNDFAATGLSGLGFEVSPDEGVRLGGSTGNLDSSRRLENVRPLEPLRAEHLYNFELGLRFRTSHSVGSFTVFDAEIANLIERRTLLLAPVPVGTIVGGQPIIRQDGTGAVFTSLSSSAVFVRTNAGKARMKGIEGNFTSKLSRDFTLNANAFYLKGTDLVTGAPPSFENGIPPVTGFVGVRWERPGNSFWLELFSNFAAAQKRFSDNDIAQPRIGGLRTREEIAGFFNGGAVPRGLVVNGILLPTGETLSQVQLRILGPELKPNQLFTKNPGFALLNLRGGIKLGERSSLIMILENLLDKNYRTMGSGIDGAGINAAIRYSFSF